MLGSQAQRHLLSKAFPETRLGGCKRGFVSFSKIVNGVVNVTSQLLHCGHLALKTLEEQTEMNRTLERDNTKVWEQTFISSLDK